MSVKPVKGLFATVNGVRLHYRDWGGAGTPVVLLHGLASTRHTWDLVAPVLGQHLRVIALDQRGHGESDQPEDSYGFDVFVADLRGLLAKLGVQRPVLVGHSWGGNVALEYAAAYPQDLSALVLVDGGFIDLSLDKLTWKRTWELLAPPEFNGVTKEEVVQWVKDRDWVTSRSDTVEEATLANFRVDSRGFVEARLRRENHKKIVRAMWEQRPARLYSKVVCPVLIIAAAREGGSDSEARFLEHKRKAVPQAEKGLARCQVVWMEDTVHDIPLQRPGDLAEIIERFVGKV